MEKLITYVDALENMNIVLDEAIPKLHLIARQMACTHVWKETKTKATCKRCKFVLRFEA